MKLVSTPSSEGKIETCRPRGEVGHARFALMKGGYPTRNVFWYVLTSFKNFKHQSLTLTTRILRRHCKYGNSLIQHRKSHPAQTSARRADYPPSELNRDNQRAASLQEVKARHGIEQLANALETLNS
jgi:hypothetical protein